MRFFHKLGAWERERNVVLSQCGAGGEAGLLIHRRDAESAEEYDY
jgi:hypothetical protein